MKIITHKFLDKYSIVGKKILIIGTFNPSVECNKAEFFYGRARNYFWTLLPVAFHEEDLKSKTVQDKIDFLNKYDIELTDLIHSVEMNKEDICNYSDEKLQAVKKWNVDNILNILKKGKVERVYFTRKTFSNIANIKVQIEKIQQYCNEKNIDFTYLSTPSRPPKYRNKQQEWNIAFRK